MKVRKLFAILMVALSVTTISAQEKIVYGGFGLPQGKFGGDDVEKTLLFADDKEGGLGLGFNVGFKFMNPISPELNWFVSADIFYNGLNSDIKDDVEDAYDNAYDECEITSFPSALNIPVMGGVNYTFADMGSMSVWAELGVGLNARILTNYEYEGKLTYGGNQYKFESSDEFDNKFLLAYQLGVGVKINDQFMIGLNYYNLGSDKVKGEGTVKIDGDSDSDDFKSSKPLAASLLAIRFGFCF